MRRALTRRLAFIMTMLTLAAEPAFAQPASAPVSAPSPEAVARANELFKAANDDVRLQKWTEAEAKYAAAFELNRSYDIAVNLGQTQYRLGKYRDAAEHLAFALRNFPVIGKPEPREKAMKRLEELRKLIASVTIRVNVPGATVLVDGKTVGRSPLETEVFVDPVARVIEAKLEGYEVAKVTVNMSAGMAQEVPLALVKSEAKSNVIGGSTSPSLQSTSVASGSTRSKGADDENVANANDDGLRRKLIIAGIASSAVTVAGGVVFAIVANAKATDEDDQRAALTLQGNGTNPCLAAPLSAGCKQLESDITAHDTFTNLSVWSFVLGGALGVGTAVYALATRTPTPRVTLQTLPMGSRRGAGVVVVGSW